MTATCGRLNRPGRWPAGRFLLCSATVTVCAPAFSSTRSRHRHAAPHPHRCRRSARPSQRQPPAAAAPADGRDQAGRVRLASGAGAVGGRAGSDPLCGKDGDPRSCRVPRASGRRAEKQGRLLTRACLPGAARVHRVAQERVHVLCQRPPPAPPAITAGAAPLRWNRAVMGGSGRHGNDTSGAAVPHGNSLSWPQRVRPVPWCGRAGRTPCRSAGAD